MNQKREIKDIINNKNTAINNINIYLDNCITSDDKHIKKADLLSFWLNDYIKYLDQEETFNSSRLKEYKRGDVIKANLGFNVGNEEGGLHYCVVLDKKNAKSFSTLTIIPLTSEKQHSSQKKSSVFIGNELYQSLYEKNEKIINDVTQQIKYCKEEFKEIKKLPEDTDEQKIIKAYKSKEVYDIIEKNEIKLSLCKKINFELSQMKKGSIALINQITTISKQRIYNPKKDFDILSGIKLSNEKMNLIDEKLKKFYIN